LQVHASAKENLIRFKNRYRSLFSSNFNNLRFNNPLKQKKPPVETGRFD
jgi:hypothetical protein